MFSKAPRKEATLVFKAEDGSLESLRVDDGIDPTLIMGTIQRIKARLAREKQLEQMDLPPLPEDMMDEDQNEEMMIQ
jgi:hypothetical protein